MEMLLSERKSFSKHIRRLDGRRLFDVFAGCGIINYWRIGRPFLRRGSDRGVFVAGNRKSPVGMGTAGFAGILADM